LYANKSEDTLIDETPKLVPKIVDDGDAGNERVPDRLVYEFSGLNDRLINSDKYC
jgi:hypothetical protein